MNYLEMTLENGKKTTIHKDYREQFEKQGYQIGEAVKYGSTKMNESHTMQQNAIKKANGADSVQMWDGANNRLSTVSINSALKKQQQGYTLDTPDDNAMNEMINMAHGGTQGYWSKDGGVTDTKPVVNLSKPFGSGNIDRTNNSANEFGNWEDADLKQYFDNKDLYGNVGFDEQNKLNSINNKLRNKYNITEDKYDNTSFNNVVGNKFSPMDKAQQQNVTTARNIDKFMGGQGKTFSSPTEIKSSANYNGNPNEQLLSTSNGYFANNNGEMTEIDEDQYVNMMLDMNGFDTSTPYSSISTTYDAKDKDVSDESGKLIDASKDINATPSNKSTAKYKTYVENDPEKAGKMDGFIDSAKSMINFKYSQNNRMAKDSVDCSSLIGRAMKMAGITGDAFVTTASMTTDKRFTKISKADIKPGDILWEKGHAGIFLGDNKTLEARYSTKKVGESTLGNRFSHAYRINV